MMQDHFSEARQTNVEAQLDLAVMMNTRAVENVERLWNLNFQVAKASAQDALTFINELLAAGSAQELMSLTIAQAQPLSHKVMAYHYHVAGIATGAQAEVVELVNTQISETTSEITLLTAEVSTNAPDGFSRMMELTRAFIEQANAGFEQLSVVTLDVMDALEENLFAVANRFAYAAEQTGASSYRAS